MKKSATSAASSQALEYFSIDKSGDDAVLATNEEGWDDLNELKESLAHTLLGFVIEIETIVNSPDLINALGERRKEFDKLINVFYSDINRFTETIKNLRGQHENLAGRITSMDQLNTFTRLSMSYQTLQIELQSLLAPTMACIILILHEIAPSHIAVNPVTVDEQKV